jgi:hypothetical protein
MMFEHVPHISLNFDDVDLDGEILISDLYYINMITKVLADTTPQEIGTVFDISPFSTAKKYLVKLKISNLSNLT